MAEPFENEIGDNFYNQVGTTFVNHHVKRSRLKKQVVNYYTPVKQIERTVTVVDDYGYFI